MTRGQVHNALARSPLASAVSRMLGDTVGDSGLERYGETLTPCLDPWRLIEWEYLRRERRATAYATAAAVAGENGAISFVNPLGSGLIAVLERVRGWSASLLQVTVSFPFDPTAAIGAAVNTSNSVDTRYGAGNYPVCLAHAGTTAAPPAGRANISACWTPANANDDLLISPLVLGPGTAVIIWAGTVNVTFRVSLAWRERKALPGELE